MFEALFDAQLALLVGELATNTVQVKIIGGLRIVTGPGQYERAACYCCNDEPAYPTVRCYTCNAQWSARRDVYSAAPDVRRAQMAPKCMLCNRWECYSCNTARYIKCEHCKEDRYWCQECSDIMRGTVCNFRPGLQPPKPPLRRSTRKRKTVQ